jgi:allophanate hydrolase subunit 1
VTYSVRIVALGDSAYLVSLGTGVDLELSARIARLANELRGRDVAGRIGVVPAYAALAVHFDPAIADAGALADLLAGGGRGAAAGP